MKGVYCLVLELEKDKKIKIGRLGTIDFKMGHYIYVGSALNSIYPRLKRHLNPQKKPHWHIDYLRQNARVIQILYKETEQKIECDIAGRLRGFDSIRGFGSSDCRCKSHLFFTQKRPWLELLEDFSCFRTPE
jgi:Uri superfamily endonuclease